MKKINIFIFALCACLGVSVGQYVQIGQCNANPELEENFDIERFSGVWYEVHRTSSPEQDSDCSYFEITITNATIDANDTDITNSTDDANIINVFHSGVNNNFQEDYTGFATLEFNTSMLTLNISMFDGPKEFWVLSTDYSNYAIAYSCENMSTTQRMIYLWVLSRTRGYPTEMIELFIDTTLEETFDIALNSLQRIDHEETACYILPDINPGESVVFSGQCDENIQVQQNFSVGDFLGIWHQISSYYTDSSDGTCVRAEYSLGAGVVDVLNSQVIDQSLLTITGTATVASSDNSAKLKVILNIGNGTVEQDLWIISTDYTSYAISYSCVNDVNNNQKRIFSWILSRTRQLSIEAQTEVSQVINSIIELNDRFYLPTDHTPEGCFFFPEASDQPVVFRGQCDLSIPAMPDFNPNEYTGLWYTIEYYPAIFQDGTCSNADYTLIGSVVDVYNTQVVNETLDTIRGTAVIASTDGTAKLSVTFPITGTNLTIATDYWVLDTDYINYSLVYSCSNIDDDRMQVSSWKLSRTKQLSATHNAAISNVMSNILVLDQRYFKPEGQSEADCFFYPTPEIGVPVVFPGECEDNIAMPNFSLSQFVGTWYEIQAYPKEEQGGQCTSHEYTFFNNNVLNFITSTVDHKIRSETNGTLISSDSTGRLTITFTSNGEDITIPFWIIDTNYNDYALAYACVNRPNDFRAVWSWKLSRTKELSSASQAAISAASENIVVLDERYYEPIDQSDSACFYLPELEPNVPVILPGQCDSNISAVQNFNVGQYLGRWRLIQTYYADFQIGTCNEANYSTGADDTVVVYNTEVVDQRLESITGSAVLASVDGSGKLLVTFPSTNSTSELWILDTDYVSYSLVYSCQNLEDDRRRVWSWKMSRTNVLTDTANAAINQIVNSINVLDDRYYQNIDRSDAACFYFPEPDSNTTVLFRGQCNESIPVVTNFQAADYLGLWYDIESYPMPNQFGSCPNAYYSLGDGVVDVYNTQVVGQRLDTIRGVAEIVGIDGEAKLNVTFNVQGVYISTNYWVLATDYNNFAYVYSCQNVNEEYMSVFSWKLSRTKSLTIPSIQQINNVMNTLDILNQDYYVDRDQTPEGCFYFPEPETDSPVVFPGQCDISIAAITNFNAVQFVGLWHEIESYPYIQTGDCVNHQFAFGTSTLSNVESSNVVNQTLSSMNSPVTLTTTDGSGRFNIQVTLDGQVQTIPFWILATDYTDYALAYGCTNLNETFRQIYSWKLSRTRVPSAAGTAAINNAMSAVDVLENRYYEPIRQTDEACFYLPDLSPFDPVTFPGQCDQNIPVINNYDVARYLGRWRLIETYYADFQIGTCNEATYTAAADGSVIVYNTEVVNQQLESITGSAVLASTDGSGKLLVTFPTTNSTTELWILDTDYDSYSLVYSCQNIEDDRRRVWSWKLSRTNVLTATANAAINQIVNSINVLEDRYYQNIDRSDAACFYFPEPNSNTSVLFRGQCNESIPVVTNFQAADYLGLWYDIESYPMPNQFGSCPNAYYSLGDGVVDVYNTQVVGQRLDTIRGVAEIVGIDGEAKLNVTFNVQGVYISTNYWVLATDYENFAYVYSCQNVNEEYMSVFSWKLSRTKSLTIPSIQQINNVMNTLDILNQDYYVDRDQTPEGCFYFPEPETGSPIVFPGQCDISIAAITNFNAEQFVGLWHEIESYPYIQTGDCVNHQFAFGTSTLSNVESSNVVNQTLSSMNSPVTLTTTDGSGRFNIQVTLDGQVQTIPFWILATDYTDYALAYGCTNLNETFRQIYSWKLSRTRVPSAAGTAAINNAMSAVDVLENRYYEPIRQTDEACFYLPDLTPFDPVTFPGQCDQNIPVINNYDVARYLGRWRLIETYYADFQIGTCNEATYTAAADGSVVVYNTEVVNQQLESITGSAVLASTDGSGKLLVTFPTTNSTTELWILDTDYDSYSLVYSCQNIEDDRRRVWSWKLSRTNVLTATANAAINQIVNSINVLDDRYYQNIDRSDAACFYFPEPDSNTTVLFRGQCNDSIPVVTNFQADKYLGLWYDVESYPMPFQFGTCPNAYYSLGDEVVYVYNTQVVGQTLDIMRGVAEIVSTSGEAKLNVTFNVQGEYVSTKYWVLATDYDNFAYVYSCENINDEYMSVFSWKLSRTKSLTTESIQEINNVMNTLDILNQDYYVDRDQTPEGCFYFPEPETGSPVVFPGQCDNNIAAITNFNPEQFAAGLWHEIESYPYIPTGDCVNHQFAFGSSTLLSVESSNVVNQTLSSINSPVTLTSTDGSGRLNIQVTLNGQVQTIPFWILATDYTDYAFAYGCTNLNETFRQIYSWKLSRTRVPTAAGTAAINNAMSAVNVLENRYYEPIRQTDEACFYLPDLSPFDPVTFPGQCDQNIPVISNFNAARYLGRWRLIETYYADFQFGTCNEATYTAAADGSVIVYNTEVVNQQLESITGSAVLATTDGSGKLEVSFPTTNVTIEYWILDTDYDSYALVYSCQNIEANRRRVWSWKMSRTNSLTNTANAAINEVVDTINVLDDRYYQVVDRSDEGCFYYPTPDEDTPVVFRGQCNMSIPAFPNFNAARYLGFWYDIQSYPAPFQNGTCNNANYTLNDDGSVRVENTQVVEQLLETWIGTAFVDSDDGSAKLNVTFNVNGIDVTTKYWVLDTDYDSYALVYSCQNINEERRAVFSWKLSRAPTLTPEADAAINTVIDTVEVLDQKYFVDRSHTEDDCFYYPDNNGGDVILPGQCLNDTSVPVITDFDINLYAGTWYEVSRFPSDLQDGECVASEYSVGNDNTFTVTKTNVLNERLVRSTSQASVLDDRGVISFNIDGVPFDNIYILGIDYNDYVLAYSCRNLDEERKQIYSWKLSRSRSGLSTAANTAINQLVSDNIDLWEGYYRITGQDNNACFYYPVFDQLPSFIELPGPCPDNIRGVPNFNAAAYLGRWFETARYPVTAQIGQCNRAEYSLSTVSGTERVFVSNTEVDDATLFTQVGFADVASNDGSGQLSVEFVVDGVLLTANYYIIATDYSSYSLVYSCANLNNGNSAVSSWKLSRTPTLSPVASALIDSAIADTRGLIEEYYQLTSQSEEDCFYVPSINLTEAPLFRGQCEEITGVEGFDPQRYLGWWHEVRSYPVDGEPGVCRSSDYRQDGNTYQVIDTSVRDNDGTTVSATVTVTSNGRLRKSIPGREDQDIWVLATDYDSYALLYSCENVNSEYRRVWSAQHSKTRSLSEEALNTMAPVIESNRVLYSQFYLEVDQSDSACFFYPSITSGDIIIPGQCDGNIPVTPNFSIDLFAGTWYHIERYDDLGSSTCLGSRFIVDSETQDISVINFEVNSDDELETVEGSATVQGGANSVELTFPDRDSEDRNVTLTVSITAALDYSSYSLVYNCININAYQRQVRAWTLSRNRTMSIEGSSAINALISQWQEFHQPYFKQIEQNEDCIEPSSAFLVKSSVFIILVGAILQWLL